MAEQQSLQKHYLPGTQEVDVDRAVYDRFASTFTGRVMTEYARHARTSEDIPKATEDLFDFIKNAPATLQNGMKIAHWTRHQEVDEPSGITILKLRLYYVSL